MAKDYAITRNSPRKKLLRLGLNIQLWTFLIAP